MNEFQQIDQLFDRLFPLFRSITGEGVRQTLQILQDYIPLAIEQVPSGTEVFDWTIPKEWVIREAWIRDAEGRDIINIANSNLHVFNYSESINRIVSLAELKPHVISIPHLPDAIPYVTSYYKERWGFCMSHRQLTALPEGNYHVYIDSEKVDGVLNYAQAVLPGRTEKEVLISSYVCHPSLANNELSGPIVAAFLYNRLKNWEQREFTYRFVFHPETIGSIAFLAQYGDHLKKHVYSGMVLTCLGGKGLPLSYKKSRNEQSPLNELISFMAGHEKREVHIRPFSPLYGSDERQYNSPGFNLSVGQFSRMIYGQYAGYHNSLDTKEAMSIDALLKSVDELEEILKLQELNGYYQNLKPFGEPMLSKYDLYPDMNSPTSWRGSTSTLIDDRQHLNQVLMLLNYSDGQHSLIDIASKQQYALSHYGISLDRLKEAGLIAGPFHRVKGDVVE
jgi:aminopeptidase-like protein